MPNSKDRWFFLSKKLSAKDHAQGNRVRRVASLLNGARMCTLCGTMSPSPSDDKAYSDWVLRHVIRKLCVEQGPTIAPDDI